MASLKVAFRNGETLDYPLTDPEETSQPAVETALVIALQLMDCVGSDFRFRLAYQDEEGSTFSRWASIALREVQSVEVSGRFGDGLLGDHAANLLGASRVVQGLPQDTQELADRVHRLMTYRQ
jgi:hypothetical protein